MQSGLVIIGEEEMDDYGDSVVPLFTACLQCEPILAEGGEVNVLSNWQADGNGGLGLLGMVNCGLSGKVGSPFATRSTSPAVLAASMSTTLSRPTRSLRSVPVMWSPKTGG